jgi:hypothetical protein
MTPSSLRPRHILIIGKSAKFIRLIEAIYPDAHLMVVSWRALGDRPTRENIAQEKIDLVLICGYDYSSYMTSYQSYIDRNVTLPLAALSPLADQAVAMIYIDTMDGAKEHTFSRYLYAKKLLGKLLSNLQTKVVILTVPTISDARGQLDIHGGWFTKQLFALMQKLGVMQTISPYSLRDQLARSISELEKFNKPPQSHNAPQAIGLHWPRPLLLDRALRMICG